MSSKFLPGFWPTVLQNLTHLHNLVPIMTSAPSKSPWTVHHLDDLIAISLFNAEVAIYVTSVEELVIHRDRVGHKFAKSFRRIIAMGACHSSARPWSTPVLQFVFNWVQSFCAISRLWSSTITLEEGISTGDYVLSSIGRISIFSHFGAARLRSWPKDQCLWLSPVFYGLQEKTHSKKY